MGDNFFDGLDESAADEQGNGPADLRKALAKAKKALDERDAELASLRGEKRAATVTDALKELGAKPGLAKFIPADISDAAGVGTWLKENGEVFGYTGPSAAATQGEQQQEQGGEEAGDEPAQSAVPAGLQALFAQMVQAEQAGEIALAPQKAQATLDALKNAGSFDAAAAILANGGV